MRTVVPTLLAILQHRSEHAPFGRVLAATLLVTYAAAGAAGAAVAVHRRDVP